MTMVMLVRYRLRRLGIILACAAGGMAAQAADTPLDGVTNAGTITINYLDTGSISSSGTFTNTGTLTLVGALNNAGTYIDSGVGVIFLHGGYASGNAAINNTSSSLMTIANLNVTGSGTLSGTGTYSLGNVTVTPVTSFSIDATTDLTGVMNCNDMLNLLSGRTLTNSGTLNCSGTGGWAACYLASGSILNNDGTISISQSTRLSALGTIYLLGTNSGNGVISYSASSGMGSSSINSIITGTGCYGTIAFDSVKDLPIASISVESGATTTITGSGSGTLSVGSATVTGTLNNTRATTVAGAFTNNGTVNNSGNLILNSTASYAGSGVLNLNGGTLTNNASAAQTVANLNIDSGNTGTFAGSAATNLTNLTLAGTLNNSSAGGVTIGTLTVASGINTAGYRFDLPKEFMLTPSYGLGFTTMYDPQYTETGATGGANLKINEFTIYSLCQNMDLKLGRLWQISRNLGLLPEIWGGWEHEYLGNGGDVTTAFASAPTQSWTSSVQTIAADRAVFGAGLTTLLCDRWSVFGRYDQKLWQGGFSTNFSAGLRVSF